MSIFVSDHAVVRWLERVHGIDIEQLRGEIRKCVAPAIKVGAATISLGNITFALSGNHVCTVLTSGNARKRRDKQRRGDERGGRHGLERALGLGRYADGDDE